MPKLVLTRRGRWKHVLSGQDDVPEEERFALFLSPLSKSEEEEFIDAALESSFSEDGKGNQAVLLQFKASKVNSIFAARVVGWENAQDEEGQPIPFKDEWVDGDMPYEYVQMFSFNHRAEAMSALFAQGKVSDEEQVGN